MGSAGAAQWHQATSNQKRAAPATAQGRGQTFPKHNVTHIIIQHYDTLNIHYNMYNCIMSCLLSITCRYMIYAIRLHWDSCYRFVIHQGPCSHQTWLGARQRHGDGSLIVTSLRWNGDEALKLMSRADELKVRETWVKMGRTCQDMSEPNILKTLKHLNKIVWTERRFVMFCPSRLLLPSSRWDQGMLDCKVVELSDAVIQSHSMDYFYVFVICSYCFNDSVWYCIICIRWCL
jgi:hypothetical protein